MSIPLMALSYTRIQAVPPNLLLNYTEEYGYILFGILCLSAGALLAGDDKA
jgi:hypothetical protein